MRRALHPDAARTFCSLALVASACGGRDAAPDAGTEPPGGSASTALVVSSSAAPPSSAAPAITHAPGTVPTAAPKKEPTDAEKKLPPVDPKLDTLAAQPSPRKAPKGVEDARWLDDTHVVLPSPGRLEIVELPGGAAIALTTGARITAFAGDMKRLVTLDESDRIVVWDPSGKTPPRALPVDPKKGDAVAEPQVALSSDGSRVASGTEVVVVWDADTGKELTRIARDVPTFGIDLTRDEVMISTNSVQIDAFRIDSGKPSGGSGFETGATFGIAVSPDGKWGAGAAPSGHGMEVSDLHHEGQRRQLVQTDDCTHHVRVGFSRDGRHAYAYLGSDWIKGFDTGTWKPYASFRAPPGRQIASTSDDLGYAVTTKDDVAPMVVLVSQNKETPLDAPLDGAIGYALTSNGALVLATNEQHVARVWSAKTGKTVYEIVP